MNSKQKIHANILIQVRRFRETKKRQKKEEEEKNFGEGKRKTNKQKNDWLFHLCEVFYDRSCEGTSDESFC